MSNKRGSYSLYIVLMLTVTAVLVLSTSASATPATDYEIISLEDDGIGSLRQAIIAANAEPGKDTITFAVSGTITLKSTLPSVGDDLVIDGSDQEIRISGDNKHRVLNLFAGDNIPELEINKLTIEKGSSDEGAAVYNSGGDLAVTNVDFYSNLASKSGAAIFNLSGGVLVTNSNFGPNAAKSGGAIFSHAGTLSINGSSFALNKSTADGGALYNSSGTATVTNSTFSLNEAAAGIVFSSDGKTTITNSTFSENKANSAVARNPGVDSSITLQNTILNDDGTKNCFGGIVNGGNNIDSGATCGWGSEKGSMSSTDPKVSSLADNGGPTPTVLPLPGSPALDGVLFDAPNSCPATDQRGITRPQSTACDIGAYESNAQPGPDFIVNVLADTNDGSCDELVPEVTDCTLREAIIASNASPGKNTITFALNGGIILSDTLPIIGGDLLIDGNDQITLYGDDQYRLMTLVAGNETPELELKKLHMAAGSSDKGGGIYNDGGELILTSSVLDQSKASENGGGIYSNNGAVTLNHSSLSGNSAESGAAVFNNNGTLTVNKSFFLLNKSTSDGSVIFNSFGNTEVTNSTLFQNISGTVGIVANSNGNTTVTNSTFIDNETKDGSISNSAGTLTLRNTILEDIAAKNCTSGITNGGNNIDSGATCAWGTEKGSMSSTDPLLGPPTFANGGITITAALLPGSPAIDAVIFNAPNDCPDEDQRGVNRPQGIACDIGAYEATPFLIYLPVVMAQ